MKSHEANIHSTQICRVINHLTRRSKGLKSETKRCTHKQCSHPSLEDFILLNCQCCLPEHFGFTVHWKNAFVEIFGWWQVYVKMFHYLVSLQNISSLIYDQISLTTEVHTREGFEERYDIILKHVICCIISNPCST